MQARREENVAALNVVVKHLECFYAKQTLSQSADCGNPAPEIGEEWEADVFGNGSIDDSELEKPVKISNTSAHSGGAREERNFLKRDRAVSNSKHDSCSSSIEKHVYRNRR